MLVVRHNGPAMNLVPHDKRAKSFYIASVSVWVDAELYCIYVLQFNFQGIISSCFEPHMTVYIELEEKTLMEHLEKLVQVHLMYHIKCTRN